MKHYFISFVVEGERVAPLQLPKEITKKDEKYLYKLQNPDNFSRHGSIVMSFENEDYGDNFLIDYAVNQIHYMVSADVPKEYVFKVTIINFQEVSQETFEANQMYNDRISASRKQQEESSETLRSAEADQQHEEEQTEESS